MSTTDQKQTLGFKTEVKQLLHLMINSLYSHREIFLRELISNASDASDKLRFRALENKKLATKSKDLNIQIEFDKEAKTMTIRDRGIGMSYEEVIDNLGTIAKSGTKSFLDKLTGDKAKDAQMIGQFGVGFYSAFMVADQIVVNTLHAGSAKKDGVCWISTGDGEYTIEPVTLEQSGTEITLHLKDDADEYLDGWRLRNVVKQYSDHISLPIEMHKVKTETPPVSGDEADANTTDDKTSEAEDALEWEVVNSAKALWTRPKRSIKDEEYKEFYKHLTYDFTDPMCWMHKQVEGKHEYTSLVYVPQTAPFDLMDRERKSGLKLYVQRVFIMDNADVLPPYLRFVKGVIDSADLPLNVSREILQSNATLDKIRSATVKNTLTMLEKMATKDADQYHQFWDTFGQVLKEGPAEDTNNKDLIAKLLRFASTHDDQVTQRTSLEDYIGRMKKDQKHIYYVIADSFNAAKNSPHIEIFRKQGIEVLLLTDRVDEWLMASLTEYEGKTFQAVTKGELDIEADEKTQKKAEKAKENYASMVDQIKEILSDKVEDVRITQRLTDSPACLVVNEQQMSMHLQRMMAATGQNMPSAKPVFEINPEHALVKKLKDQADDEVFKEWSEVLFDQALLAEGGQLEDPASFVKRINKLLSQ